MDLDFPALFDEHYDSIASYVARRLIDRSIAEDIASEAFREAYAHRATYDPAKGTARSWLFGIAINLIRHHSRSEDRRLRAYARAASRQIETSGVDEICERADAQTSRGAIAAALAALSSVDRDVLTMHCWLEFSYEEVATVLGVPEGTVKSRLHRARRQVRAQLAPTLSEAHDG